MNKNPYICMTFNKNTEYHHKKTQIPFPSKCKVSLTIRQGGADKSWSVNENISNPLSVCP